MADDDQRNNPEFLREDKPEKNKRSFFEWLTGKEESEEEKLRKKLDKELKEAARKRAEEEELRRANETNEEAETRKLKKKWRKKLLEKSKKQLEELQHDESEPLDGYQLAQYMVAEKIVELHKTLEEEDLRRSEIKTLKVHIDFMGLLSEKLSNPELEMPKEVENVYRAIIETSSPEERVDEGPTPQESAGENAAAGPTTRTSIRPKPTPPPAPETPAKEREADEKHLPLYGAAVVGIVVALKRAIQQERAVQEHLDATTALYGSEDGPEASYDALPSSAEPTVAAPAQVNRLRELIREVAAPVTALREELRQARAVERLADAVAKADTLRAAGKLEAIAPPIAAGALAMTVLKNPEKTAEQPLVGIEYRDTTTSERRSAASEAPTQELEELTTAELLTLAAPVALGAGRYLKFAFENGEIDREGLIKVLKAYQKGFDYRTEFNKRSESWRRSHERLTGAPLETTPVTAPPATQSDKPSDEELEQARARVPEPPVMIQSPKDLFAEAKRLTKSAHKSLARKYTARMLLLTSIALTLIVIVIVVAIFTY